MYNPYFTGSTPRMHSVPPISPTPDRQEIIRKIKERGNPQGRLVSADGMPHAAPSLPVTPAQDSSSFPLVDGSADGSADRTETGLAIIRPGSALHKGDFHAQSPSSWQYNGTPDRDHHLPHNELATSPVVPWHRDFPRTARPELLDHQHSRRSTVSFSPSASFSYQAPTSPLVHQFNAGDMPDEDALGISGSAMRRAKSENHDAAFRWPLAHRAASDDPYEQRNPFIRNPSMPYKAHQPRLSVGSSDYHSRGVSVRARRTSSSGARSSMVGSFEESILMGRMSSSPSVPVDFTAQIGVLGLGDCKNSLKCPPHITVPFPAVFYSYGNNSAKSQPSPYVGLVDLEGRTAISASNKRKSRNSNVPKGAYRIPARGQLQVVIKNPHKTAVKLFLVPYDLSTMQPGQKTFIRQRSLLSDGQVVDMPLSALKDTSLDEIMPKPAGRTVMRYMIQLHICCLAKGRLYLHKNIRVVFANRVPDGKERLQNDTQYPEPRYSPYKPAEPEPEPEPSGDHLSKRRRSEILPGSTRDVLRLDTAQTLVERRDARTVGPVVFEEPGDAQWLMFSKREVGGKPRDVGDPAGPGVGLSPKSGSESLLVKRLRDMEMQGL